MAPAAAAPAWTAITNPDFTKDYFYGTRVTSDWKKGSPVVHLSPEGAPMLEGKILEIDPPKRLVATFIASHNEEHKKDRPSRVTWEIQLRGEVCKLTVTHDDFDGETATYKSTGPGWNPVLSGLKTLLETGKSLVIAPEVAKENASV